MAADAVTLVFDRPHPTPALEWSDREVLALVMTVARLLLGEGWQEILADTSRPVSETLDAWTRALTTPTTQVDLAIARVRLQAATTSALAVERTRRLADPLTTKETRHGEARDA